MEKLLVLLLLCFLFTHQKRVSSSQCFCCYTSAPAILDFKNKRGFEEPSYFWGVCYANTSHLRLIHGGSTPERKVQHHQQLTESTYVRELGKDEAAPDPHRYRIDKTHWVGKRVSGIIALTLRNLLSRPKKFKFNDLKNATNNFDEKLKLGGSEPAAIYKGILHKQNLEVAIRRILTNRKQKGKSGFLVELNLLHRLRHRHLVPFYGWCYEKGMLLLVHGSMPNGSLSKHLLCDSGTVLTWAQRYKILLAIASALQYLHKRSKENVVHGNLKSSNIMLDSELNACLVDFCVPENGRARYTDTEGVSSTFGYTAPECVLTRKAVKASDVYAYGAILLEVTCGRRPWIKIGSFRCLVNWVWWLYRKGQILEAMDVRLANKFVAEEAERILLLGLACSRPIAKDRPKSDELLEIILGNVPTPDIPQFRQAATSLSLELQRTKH